VSISARSRKSDNVSESWRNTWI
jgi:hypothetical protein